MADLHTTLKAKVTAHLELAQAATPGPWHKTIDPTGVDNPEIFAAPAWFEEEDGRRYYGGRQIAVGGEGNLNEADTEHIAANDPDHVIRACRADLERLELHQGILINTDEEPGWELNCWTCRGRPPSPCPEVRLIASVYGVEEK